MLVEDYVEEFRDLHRAVVKGMMAPHKVVLLLALIDLVEFGVIDNVRFQLSDALVDRFHYLWNRYLGNPPYFRANICQPFFHLQYESFWRLLDQKDIRREKALAMAADIPPFVKDRKQIKELTCSYSIKAMRQAFPFAEIDSALFDFLKSADHRARFRRVLIASL